MSNNNKMPEGWGQNKSVPDAWKKANSLPENWGTQKNGAAKKAPSVPSRKSEERIDGSENNVVVPENVDTETAPIEINNATPDHGSLSAEIISSESETLSAPNIEDSIADDTEIGNESNSFENVSYEEHTDIEAPTTNKSPQDNTTPVNAADWTETAEKVAGRIANYTSNSGKILLSEEAADLDAKISYLKKEKSLKEHELKNTSAMSANKRELKDEVDNYNQVLNSGISELHSVNAADVLKYCSAEDVIGKTISYGLLNGDFIEWTLIENTGNSITMLSNEIVFHSPFDLSDNSSIVFKNSYIRQLLNAPQFMTKFFTLEEAVHITGLSLPRQADIAKLSNPDLNEAYWLLSVSNRGDETPLAMNAYGNIIGETMSKKLGVRLKLEVSPDVNYDIIKVYEEKENNPPKAGVGTKKILMIAGGAVAAIALIVGGIFAGSKLIHKSSSDSSSKNDDIVVSGAAIENVSDDVEDISDDVDSYSLDDKASSLQKAAESALTDIDAKYGLNYTNIALFSSDPNYRFYFNDEFSSYADEFEKGLKNYFEDVKNLNYILEIHGGSCIASVVENENGEIGRFPSINNIEDYDMDLFIPKSGGTFKEIADQALANAQKYMEEHPAPVVTGNKLKFYSSDKINDYPAYLEKLRDLQTNGTYRDQNNGFFLCDINEDDTPELFVTFNTDEPGILFAGSVYSGELVSFAEFMGAGMLRGITLFDNGAIGIASGGNEGYGMSYKYYSGGNSFSDQNNNDESISYIYENGSLSYISYQNGGQEKHITEAEVEQIEQKYVEASYTAAPVSSVIENESSSKFSNQELGYMYNQYYIRAYTDGSIGGGYIIDYDKDGTDELICSAQGGLWIIKYQNGDTQSAGQVSQNISSTYYGREELKNKLLELTEKYGYGVNSNFVYNSDPAIGFVSTSDMFGTLNLRKEPSTNSEVITQLPNGLMFNSTSNPYDKSAFCYITTTYNGQTYSGYVSSDYVVLFEKGL